MADDTEDAKGLRAQIQAQAAENAKLRAELARQESAVSEWGAKATAWESERTALATARETETKKASTLAEELALADIGLTDPSGRIVARALHTVAGEKAGALPDWLKAMKAAPEAAPVGLRAYLTPAKEAATLTTTKKVDTKAPGGEGGTGGGVDMAALRNRMLSGSATAEDKTAYYAAAQQQVDASS
jgi:hypothetical protein